MTTLTVDIQKAEDLEAVKDFLIGKGLYYEIEDQDFVVTDDIKRMLDEREADYLSGKDVPITAEESKKRVQAIINRRR